MKYKNIRIFAPSVQVKRVGEYSGLNWGINVRMSLHFRFTSRMSNKCTSNGTEPREALKMGLHPRNLHSGLTTTRKIRTMAIVARMRRFRATLHL